MIPTKHSPVVLSLLRIWTGFVFMPHGAQKLFGAFEGLQAELFTQRGLAGMIEFFGGLLILLGLWTRPVAFLCSGTMAVAYWQVHGFTPGKPLPLQNGGELATVFCFLFLYLATVGGGPWSLDSLIAKKRK